MNALWVALVEVLALGAVFLVLPRIGRRGLLFGVYVGEERWASDAARRILRAWYGWMIAVITVCAAACALLAELSIRPEVFAFAPLVVLIAFVWVYLRSHRAARALAMETVTQVEDAPAEPLASTSLLPVITTGVAVAAALGVMAFALFNYGDLPARIPTHFNASGAPDRWSERSLVQILILPLMALGFGAFLGLFSHWTAHAKRSLRHADGGVSVLAQDRFRLAISRMLCATNVLVVSLLTLLSYSQIQVARGLRRDLTPWVGGIGAIGIPVVLVGGLIYIMVRYGQGGARLEKPASKSALTDGLADNRFWKWGLFYVNPQDPSFLVEKRFGFGYTLNFGNRWAVVVFVAFLVFVLGLTLTAILTG
jgi:uncharacterized membrane protein